MFIFSGPAVCRPGGQLGLRLRVGLNPDAPTARYTLLTRLQLTSAVFESEEVSKVRRVKCVTSLVTVPAGAFGPKEVHVTKMVFSDRYQSIEDFPLRQNATESDSLLRHTTPTLFAQIETVKISVPANAQPSLISIDGKPVYESAVTFSLRGCTYILTSSCYVC